MLFGEVSEGFSAAGSAAGFSPVVTSVEVLITAGLSRFSIVCVLVVVAVWVHTCVKKANGWGSVALQTRPLHVHVTAREIRGYRRGPTPEREFCEVIGWILLYGVAVMLHRLIREALVGQDSHRE